MYYAESAGTVAFRLQVGEGVHQSLIQICEKCKISAAFINSGIGMLEDPELGFFVSKGEYAKKVFKGNFELLNLSGNFSQFDGGLMGHLHVMLANEDYSVFGGHLFTAKVGLTLEGYIQSMGTLVMRRELEAATGLPGLLVE